MLKKGPGGSLGPFRGVTKKMAGDWVGIMG